MKTFIALLLVLNSFAAFAVGENNSSNCAQVNDSLSSEEGSSAVREEVQTSGANQG